MAYYDAGTAGRKRTGNVDVNCTTLRIVAGDGRESWRTTREFPGIICGFPSPGVNWSAGVSKISGTTPRSLKAGGSTARGLARKLDL